MKLMKYLWIAMLSPSLAVAWPYQDNTQSKEQGETDSQSQTSDCSPGQGRLGVTVIPLTPELRAYFGAPKDAGLLVAQVDNGSLAETAGIKVGDVITKVGDTDVNEATDVTNTLSQNAQQKTPSDLSLQVIRDRQSMDLQASRAPRKNRPDNSFEI